MEERYDAIIIGGGPAGLAATIHVGRAGREILMIEEGSSSGHINNTKEVWNYPGFTSDSDAGLMQKFRAHAQPYATNVFKWTMVTGLEMMGDGVFLVHIKRHGDFTGDSATLDTEAKSRVLNIPDEIELAGRGAAYYATCDAEFFRGKEIYALGVGDQTIGENGYLVYFMEKVIVIALHEKGHLDCSEVTAAEAYVDPKMEFVWNTTLQEIPRGEEVRGLTPKNVVGGEIREVRVDGAFFFVGMVP